MRIKLCCLKISTEIAEMCTQITLKLEENLLNEALQLAHLTIQKELIRLALQGLFRSRRKKNLLDLAGQIQFAPEFEYKALRETRRVTA